MKRFIFLFLLLLGVVNSEGAYIPFNPGVFTPFPGAFSTTINTNIVIGNLPAGITDITTAPSGYLLSVQGIRVANATNALTITNTIYLKTNGLYIPFSATVANLGLTGTAALTALGWVMPGETLAVSNNLPGLNFSMSAQLVITNNLFVSRILPLGATTNVLYTNILNKLVYMESATGSASVTAVNLLNTSATQNTNSVYLTHTGESPNATNAIFVAAPLANNAVGNEGGNFYLSPGDAIWVGASGAGLNVFLNLWAP